jgi:hypothetical protein
MLSKKKWIDTIASLQAKIGILNCKNFSSQLVQANVNNLILETALLNLQEDLIN